MAGRCAQDWMDMLVKATENCAVEMMELENTPIKSTGAGPAPTGPGAYLTLAGNSGSVQMGMISSMEGCQRLAGMLMCMDAEESKELSSADMVDAYGEIINVTGGIVKQLVNAEDPSFHLGLPMFINGQVCPMEHQNSVVTELLIGEVTTYLLVLTPDT